MNVWFAYFKDVEVFIMKPEVEPATYESIDARISRRFPIRHVLIYKWEFDKAKSWEDVKRIMSRYYYWIEAEDGSVVFTAPVKPTVIGILRKNGELIVINMDKHYSLHKLEGVGKKYIEKNTGLKLKKV